MTKGNTTWSRPFSLALLLLAGSAWNTVQAQPATRFNERTVRPQVNVQDKGDVWVLDFKFKDPRMLSVNIPGRGKRLVWYMWYQVTNNTGEPRYFIPDFELVTLDKNTVHHDQVLPSAQRAIMRVEDPFVSKDNPDGYYNIKNSVTIAAQPIPPSKPEAAPRPVTGVAVWDDVDPDTNHFAIFVSGLSNGWSRDDKDVVRRKTLQLNFERRGDRFFQNAGEINFKPPEAWVYRAMTPLKSTGAPAPDDNKDAPPPAPAKPAGGDAALLNSGPSAKTSIAR